VVKQSKPSSEVCLSKELSVTIELVLPNRIGDAILSLPAVVALKQLQTAYGPVDQNVNLYAPSPLLEVIRSCNLFETRLLTPGVKFHSWIKPANQAFFLCASSEYIGLRARKTYGQRIPGKWYLNYDVHMPYMVIEACEDSMPPELVGFLQEKFGFSLASIRHFGICLELGYSVEQLIATFSFEPSHLHPHLSLLDSKLPVALPEHYVVFCLEAGYGSRREEKRRWDPETYIALAEQVYREFQLPTVFLGLQTAPILPECSYFMDLRQKLSILQAAQLLGNATLYIGNDSGLLHLANLMQVPSLGIYLTTTPQTYGPVFPHINTALRNPEAMEAVWSKLCETFLSLLRIQR
jgi:Glycosyltransferase family 9 (heptosyltransferase)